MATNNTGKNTRIPLVTTNKYEENIILLTFLPSALIFLTFICIIFISNPAFSKIVFHTSFLGTRNLINRFSGLIVVIMCLIFILSLIGAFIISHNMVGAFGRITRELDDIIAGRSQRIISSRPDDTLTKELLKRINVLIEYYVQNKKKSP